MRWMYAIKFSFNSTDIVEVDWAREYFADWWFPVLNPATDGIIEGPNYGVRFAAHCVTIDKWGRAFPSWTYRPIHSADPGTSAQILPRLSNTTGEIEQMRMYFDENIDLCIMGSAEYNLDKHQYVVAGTCDAIQWTEDGSVTRDSYLMVIDPETLLMQDFFYL